MATRLFSVDEVISGMDDLMAIPGPVDEDEWSEDEFDGYVESDVEDQGECTNESEMQNEDVELGEGVLGDSECAIPTYTYMPDCTQPLGDGSSFHLFQMLVTDDMLEHVTHTRLYARQFISAHTIAPRSRVQQWSRQEFDGDELKRFIALVTIMGLVNLPKVEDHWVTSWPYST